jgi:hypothetical protein
MEMIRGSTDGQRWNSILPSDAANIAMKLFLQVLLDHWPSLRGRKHDMNQTTHVTVSHASAFL